MKTHLPNESSTYPVQKRSLHELVNQLANTSISLAVRRKSFIVNDVPESFPVNTDENMLAAILSGIIQTVVTHTENSCIRISAKMAGNAILVNVSDSNHISNQVVISGLREFQPLAEKMGGYLSITSKQEKVTAIMFSFPHLVKAA